MKRVKSKSKMNPTTKKCVIISGILFTVLVIGGSIFYVKSIQKVKREMNQVNLEMENRINGATRSVYRAINDIKKGQVISEDSVELVADALSDDPQEDFITTDDLGKEATIDIAAGQAINTNMVASSFSENWSETELNCIWLSTNLKQYDYVDIRILFPNGTDYIIASKKCVRKIDLSTNNAFWWLNEDELLAVDAAIVDANRQGAKIYTTRYAKPAIQEAHTVTYQPTEDVIDLMKTDPNIVAESARKLSKDARAAMEEKLEAFKDSVVKQQDKEEEEGYGDFGDRFHLDTTTGGDSDNNNGVTKSQDDTTDEYADEEDPGLESSRNTDASNETTRAQDEAVTNGTADTQ